MIGRLVLILCLAIVVACASHPEHFLQLVCLVDVTGSIAPEARKNSVEAVSAAFRRISRGDSVTIIPITGDAQADGPNQILRYRLSLEREPYDADRRRLGRQAEAQLNQLLASTMLSPYSHSDLLGTLEIAAEEFSIGGTDADKVLIFLTDFIQDDAQFDFKRDPRLTCERDAKALAGALAAANEKRFRNVRAYLGSLQSLDLRGLPRVRRNAIRVFWAEFLVKQGASVKWSTDGSGQLTRFLEELHGERLKSE